MTQIIITTDRLKLRHWKDEDAEPFIKLNKDPDVMRFFPALQTAEETIQQIERIKSTLLIMDMDYMPYKDSIRGDLLAIPGSLICHLKATLLHALKLNAG